MYTLFVVNNGDAVMLHDTFSHLAKAKESARYFHSLLGLHIEVYKKGKIVFTTEGF